MANIHLGQIEIRNKFSTAGVIFGLVFFLFGAAFGAIGGYNVMDNLEYKKHALSTKGKVIELVRIRGDDRRGNGGYSYTPLVEFIIPSGKYEFQHSVRSNPPAFRVGEEVDVLYNAEDPFDAKINSSWVMIGFPLIFVVLGGIFALIGLGVMYSVVNRHQQRKKLVQSGTRIYAEFDCVDFHAKNKSADYWTIKASWLNERDNKLYLFESDQIYFNPERFITDKQIPVLIDLKNPKIYWMDLSSLPRT